ncbi:hypothetical protein BBO99_00002702 [Phytophthora kernoviae]|uniref:Glutamate carboxypeptidase n=2 Tax=Phytophthora kernoviae TaxID=325452 RepID=A0A3R7G724_9STRA|nr:hypothetical protein G195_003849 [Phytophthora kernoviae 00238/432]KAG2529355.1 hypothetical protein JM18_002834 [Phytophthora kernoviae]RLN36631.1 hypothetical protein BBI17_002659 [Phytophthora kernoviae]RLN82726.1 hypothetical protein BBO99_00002702 [Phytophthora kernoviae]
MMSLVSPAESTAPVRRVYDDHDALDAGSDIYGTFQGHIESSTVARPRSSSKLWRSFGIATVLLLVASYMLLQSYSEPSSSSVREGHTPKSSVAAPEAAHKSTEQEDDTVTLSHKHKSDESDGLSKLERKFLKGVDTTQIRKYHGAYASVPHPAGSYQDYKTALFTAEQLKSFGIKTEIVEYYPLLSLPIHRYLSILSPPEAARELNLTEATVPGDSCTSNEDALPPYLGYSGSGNVTASVVYVNFAQPKDFQWLKDSNITLEGKIALVRYGGNFRGLKVMLAEQHGMAGVLIYSDPKDDGFGQGPVYPEGPWRPEGSFQRGSVQYNSISGGDPLTPGFPSLPGEPYLSIEECKTIPHIPALPLSYGQARYILESLGGKNAPDDWQGALDLENGGYHVGDDEATILNLDVAMDNSIGPIWDVIGTIEGTEEPDQMVVIGNHRDAWVCGAVDPSSGSAVMLEIARGLGELLADGWKPRRTLVISSWDGEELGLLGSTEFAEDHAEVLKKQAVAYINVDNVVGPFVSTSGTPSIAKFLQETAQLVPGNPFHGVDVSGSLYEEWVSQTAIRRSSLAAGTDDGTLAPDHLIQFMGSGTDFTAFYQHLGIISANLGFTIGSATYGTYHSTMDSIPYVETVGDPHYATHTTTAKWWGLITLRLVDDDIVPFDFSTYGLVMQEDLAGYEKITVAMERNVSYTALYEAIGLFTSNAEIFQARIAAFAEKRAKKKANHKTETERHFWNEKLISLERYLLSDAGLPHRPWFKHVIFGPGFYEGYKGAAFPGISDSIVFEDDATPSKMSSPAEAYGTFGASAPSREQHDSRWKKVLSSTSARVSGLVAILVVVVGGFLLFQSPSSSSTGISAGNGTGLTSSEQTFVDGVQPEKLREFLHAYASVPHTCGTEQDYKTAVYTAQQFEAFGLKAEIKEYYTLLSYPIHRRLAIVSPEQSIHELDLSEPYVPGDACTNNSDALPPFLAYSDSGNVTASVVYVNYGTQADFDWLVSSNVTLEGKIALVRYGRNFRGLKAMLAEQHGMAGVLIYSDPNEDGFTQGPVYPEGIYRPKGSFQRGSLQYLSLASGDPLTPGWASVQGAEYLKYEDVDSIPHIPALPLSYEQADIILRSMGGQKAPTAWQGGLTYPEGYRLGDDESLVLNLDVFMDNKIGPIWDVIGTIEGAVEPDQQVLIGNHRDAWVCGAVDPSSGSAVMMEIARGLGELLKQGWKPRRSIVLGSWDGEEYGLLGSTEFAEENAEELKQKAVAYINVDNVVGPLALAMSTPSIAKFIEDTAKVVPPNEFFGKGDERNEPGDSLYAQWIAQTARHRSQIYGVYDGTLAPDHLIQFMGSGSDFTAFYQHLGVISANLGFTLNGAVYGTYHSNMDSLMYMETLGDPHYATHANMAQWWGLMTMRLATDVVVPFDFTTYALVMQEDLKGLEQKISSLGRDVNFTELHTAIATFGANADTFHAHIQQFEPVGDSNSDALLRQWNEKLVLLERHLISETGLPHRPWYKHVIFGPGFYEGYLGAAFPGISDSVAFSDNSSTMQEHVDDVARIVTDAANYLVA